MNIRELTTGLTFPEGPVAMDDGTLLVGEIPLGRITRIKPDGSKQTLAEPGGGTNGLAIGPDGAIYVCNNGASMDLGGHNANYKGGRIERVNISTGKVERIYENCDGKRLHSPNDLVFDAQGGFYFTDVGHAGADEHGDFRWFGGVYYAKADGSSIACVVPRVTSANGVGLSPDGKTLYFADTGSCRSFGVPVKGPGEVDLGPDWRHNYFLGTYRGSKGALFDSLGVQADGGVCVATLQVGGITTFGPAEAYRFDQMPGDPFVTNICWGGKDMKTAYVTLSGTGKVVAVDWPTPGLRLNYNA